MSHSSGSAKHAFEDLILGQDHKALELPDALVTDGPCNILSQYLRGAKYAQVSAMKYAESRFGRTIRMNAIVVVQSALDLARSRLNESPGYPIYASCVAQLEYLLSTLDGRVAVDRSKLRTFTIGHYAAREFEESDEELSRALKDAYLIASKLADGSRIT